MARELVATKNRPSLAVASPKPGIELAEGPTTSCDVYLEAIGIAHLDAEEAQRNEAIDDAIQAPTEDIGQVDRQVARGAARYDPHWDC